MRSRSCEIEQRLEKFVACVDQSGGQLLGPLVDAHQPLEIGPLELAHDEGRLARRHLQRHGSIGRHEGEIGQRLRHFLKQRGAHDDQIEHRGGGVDDELSATSGTYDAAQIAGVDLGNGDRAFFAEKAARAFGVAISAPDGVQPALIAACVSVRVNAWVGVAIEVARAAAAQIFPSKLPNNFISAYLF